MKNWVIKDSMDIKAKPVRLHWLGLDKYLDKIWDVLGHVIEKRIYVHI